MQAAKHCSLFDLTRFHELSESCRYDVMAGDGGSSAGLYNECAVLVFGLRFAFMPVCAK